MFEMVDDKGQKALIKVIGVGGCGGNAVDFMIEKNVQGVEFICINTDLQALKKSQASTIIQIGDNLTKGLGAGSRPDTGKQAAIDDKEKIVQAIQGADMLFITAGMGGGTGTGATPIIAQAAKELGILTVAVVTKPFDFEGRRTQIAKEGISELVNYVDSLIVIPNEKLMGVLGEEVTFVDAFGAANNVLNSAVEGIAEIINNPGLINVDFSDVKTVMSEMGVAVIGSGFSEGPDRALSAAKEAVSCPLLEEVNLNNAKGILVNISASKDFKMREYFEVMDHIKKYAAENASIIVGSVIDDSLNNHLRVTMVATGLSTPVNSNELHHNEKIDSSSFNNEDTNIIEEINFSPEVSDGLNVFEENVVGVVVQPGIGDESEYDTPSFLRSRDKEKNDFSKND